MFNDLNLNATLMSFLCLSLVEHVVNEYKLQSTLPYISILCINILILHSSIMFNSLCSWKLFSPQFAFLQVRIVLSSTVALRDLLKDSFVFL